MWISRIRAARDYNRGVAAPVRWVHVAWAAVGWPLEWIWTWAMEPERRMWAPVLLIAAVTCLILYPFDGPISRGLRNIRLGGDIRRELEAIQQFGQGLFSVLIALVIWLQDPERRRRLADWAAAAVVALVVVNILKMGIGRPRPKFDDPAYWLGPFDAYPLGPGRGVHHAWEFWEPISSDLWSMPSSHTAYAFVAAVFLGAMYPRLKWLVVALACVVGFARVWTGAHYPTDVVAGWAVGVICARSAVGGGWGVWVLDSFGGDVNKRSSRGEKAPAPHDTAGGRDFPEETRAEQGLRHVSTHGAKA